MPRWIEQRVTHILAKHPNMPTSEAWAIGTQQAHALGKSPKDYGTKEGRDIAKAKYKTPQDDRRIANPGHLESEKMSGVWEYLNAPIPGTKKWVAGTPLGDAIVEGARKLVGGSTEAASKLPAKRTIEQIHRARLAAYRAKTAEAFFDEIAEITKTAFLAGGGYLLDQVGKPKTRKESSEPPDKSLVIKQGMFPTEVPEGHAESQRAAQKHFKESQRIGGSGATKALPGVPNSAGSPSSITSAKVAEWAKQAVSFDTLRDVATKRLSEGLSSKDLNRHLDRTMRGSFNATRSGNQAMGNKWEVLHNALAQGLKHKEKAKPAQLAATVAEGLRRPLSLATTVAEGARNRIKVAFNESGFGPTGGVFQPRYHSSLPGSPIPAPSVMDPNLKQGGGLPVEQVKKAGIPLTPKGRLANTAKKGQPKVTEPSGPSTAEVAKPIGFGRPLPGATKR